MCVILLTRKKVIITIWPNRDDNDHAFSLAAYRRKAPMSSRLYKKLLDPCFLLQISL
jgi:hypothetical protein